MDVADLAGNDIIVRLRAILDEFAEEDEPLETSGTEIAPLIEAFVQSDDTSDSYTLETEAEFLDVASEVTLKKARHLIPQREESEDDSEEQEEAQELLRHLVEYRRYREVTDELSRRAEKMSKSHPRFPPEIREWEDALADVEGAQLTDLVKALESLLEEDSPQTQTIERETITVADCMSSLRKKLQSADGPLDFADIFPVRAGRRIIVVTFVALLELIRSGEVQVAQNNEFGDITVHPTA